MFDFTYVGCASSRINNSYLYWRCTEDIELPTLVLCRTAGIKRDYYDLLLHVLSWLKINCLFLSMECLYCYDPCENIYTTYTTLNVHFSSSINNCWERYHPNNIRLFSFYYRPTDWIYSSTRQSCALYNNKDILTKKPPTPLERNLTEPPTLDCSGVAYQASGHGLRNRNLRFTSTTGWI